MYKIFCFDCEACNRTDNREGAFHCNKTNTERKPTDAPCNKFKIRYKDEEA